MPFPRVPDHHKPEKPLVPNCYGIFYALISVCYWFVLSFLGFMGEKALALATSVLFGSTMGLFDDMVDLRWRYKAVLPVFASLPFMVLKPSDRTTIATLLFGAVDLSALFFILLVPVIVTVTTNTHNMLGGLNGLEALSGLIVMIGLVVASRELVLMVVPIACLMALAYLSWSGKAFVGNVGTFSVGLTLAIYAILMNIKLVLLISLAPFILNSMMILFSNYILHERADTLMDEHGRLHAHRVRSLRTMILHYKRMKEHQAVILICLTIAASTSLALAVHWWIH
ncbi:MAG: hypothetical protein ACE5Z5_07470 [Candidatus Bathyarchaeia archaeon]